MSTILKFGTLKQLGAVLIAVMLVLAAGVIVGQAPTIFGADVAEDREASIEFSDQTGDGTTVTVDNVSLSHGGFVVVTDSAGGVVGVSPHLESGEHENVTVEQRGDEDVAMLGQLTATVHRDANDDETFDAPEADEADPPYLEDGYPVRDRATVTAEEGTIDQTSSTSFLVESAEAPPTATINETVDVTAEIRNPNAFETRQHVEFRLDGTVIERQILSLDAEETRNVTFQIDLGGVEPGTYTYGVYTTDDGSLGDLRVDHDAPPAVSVREATAESVTANASIPAGGFVAVENETGDVIGTSRTLDPGEHENVTVAFEEPVEDGETLTVVLYHDADDVEDAEPYRDEGGERVVTTATAEEPDDGSDADDSSGNESGASESN